MQNLEKKMMPSRRGISTVDGVRGTITVRHPTLAAGGGGKGGTHSNDSRCCAAGGAMWWRVGEERPEVGFVSRRIKVTGRFGWLCVVLLVYVWWPWWGGF